MSSALHTLDTPEAKRRDAAMTEIQRLIDGGKWRMHIPVEEDRDSDMILSAVVSDSERLEAQRDRYAAVLRRISTFSVRVGNCEGCRESAHVADLFYELREIAAAALKEEAS